MENNLDKIAKEIKMSAIQKFDKTSAAEIKWEISMTAPEKEINEFKEALRKVIKKFPISKIKLLKYKPN